MILTRRKAMLSLATAASAVALTPRSDLFAAAIRTSALDGALERHDEMIDPYQRRFGRAQPVVAVLADNSGTELSDFVVPFGILSRSKSAKVIAVSLLPGTVPMRPALRLEMQQTTAQFDAGYREGADYVIVPAMMNETDPSLLAWIKAQAAKGSTIVSICNGAIVVANTGLMNGHRATAHWGTESLRLANYPDVRWEKNIRYVADGKIVSSSGISASIVISLALVEAIAGHERAAAVAREVGVAQWSSRHNSDSFQWRPGEKAKAGSMRDNHDAGELIGIPVAPGIDEVALALTAEAYTHSHRAHAVAMAEKTEPVLTLHGLLVIPENIAGRDPRPDRVLPSLNAGPSVLELDKTLAEIEATYGREAAYSAARVMEYPYFSENKL
jgi:putative intracellular protease/amidase